MASLLTDLELEKALAVFVEIKEACIHKPKTFTNVLTLEKYTNNLDMVEFIETMAVLIIDKRNF